MQRVEEHQSEIKKTMKDGEIQDVSIASGTSNKNIETLYIPNKNEGNNVYGAASLSKPVFSYLVLKLIGSYDNDGYRDFSLDETNLNKIYPFKDFCEKHGIKWEDTKQNRDRVNQFTPAMALSHQTGLPIGYNPNSGPLKFDFEPGQGYAYSGWHLMYLQDCIEKKFGKKLEELARTFVFDPADMSKKTTFYSPDGKPANAANSLHTTAEDYARFCIHMMNDPDPNVQKAFTSQVSLTKDPWAIHERVSTNTLERLAWGFGWGLEKNDRGEVIGAFHTGDMNEWRSGVKLDLVAKSATVLFTKSTYQNGHLLQEKIFGNSPALDYFFDKFKFARNIEELKSDWRVNRSYGLRKEPAQPAQAKDGPTNDTSTGKIFSKLNATTVSTVTPKPKGALPQTMPTEQPVTQKASPSSPLAPPSPMQPDEPRRNTSMTPLNTRLVPPGTIKK